MRIDVRSDPGGGMTEDLTAHLEGFICASIALVARYDAGEWKWISSIDNRFMSLLK